MFFELGVRAAATALFLLHPRQHVCDGIALIPRGHPRGNAYLEHPGYHTRLHGFLPLGRANDFDLWGCGAMGCVLDMTGDCTCGAMETTYFGEGVKSVGISATQVVLAPGSAVLCREETVIQFGMDATRVGVAETGSALTVATAFNTAREPVSPEDLSERLRAAGLEKAAALSLIEDALDYGILWPHNEADAKADAIVLMGGSALAERLRARLEADGFQVRIPLEEDNVFSYIHDLDGMYPVLAVDQLHCPLDCANALAGTGTTWIPVSLLDNRGVIGPVCIRGQDRAHCVRTWPAWIWTHCGISSAPSSPTCAALQKPWCSMRSRRTRR